MTRRQILGRYSEGLVLSSLAATDEAEHHEQTSYCIQCHRSRFRNGAHLNGSRIGIRQRRTTRTRQSTARASRRLDLRRSLTHKLGREDPDIRISRTYAVAGETIDVELH